MSVRNTDVHRCFVIFYLLIFIDLMKKNIATVTLYIVGSPIILFIKDNNSLIL